MTPAADVIAFNAAASALQGPADLSFNRDRLLVANSKGGNSVQVLNSDGSLFTSITNALFNNPWGVTTGFTRLFSPISTFFVGNKSDAKVLRVDVQEGRHGAAPTFEVTVVGSSAAKTTSMIARTTAGRSTSCVNFASTASSTRPTGSTRPLSQTVAPRFAWARQP